MLTTKKDSSYGGECAVVDICMLIAIGFTAGAQQAEWSIDKTLELTVNGLKREVISC